MGPNPRFDGISESASSARAQRPPEDAEITQAQFTQMMEDPFSFFITQQLTVGNVRSLKRLCTEVVPQLELRARLESYLERMQQLGFLAMNGDEIIVNKMGFRFKLDRRAQGRLFPALFEISTNAAIRAVEQAGTAPILFLISEDPITSGEISKAVENFRAEMRVIGERVKTRDPRGVRAIGIFNTPMLSEDFVAAPESLATQTSCSPGTVERRLSEVAQAAHDMAPAIQSLELIAGEAREKLDPEILQLLELTTERIRKTYQHLLPKGRRKGEDGLANGVYCALAAYREASKIKPHRISVEYEGPAESSATLQLANSELTRAIGNLLKNAIEASDTKVDGRVLLSLQESEDLIQITVQDNGPGFDPEVLNEIQRERWTTTKLNGSGIGIRQATEATQKAGGDLLIESTPGHGTTIRVRLPVLRIKPS
ncbi:MAG: GHKL domain-containing protein [Bdellovibrionales bacterium]|nr:GHKL domain-containing protein [Bdellovibrionales bacterium]